MAVAMDTGAASLHSLAGGVEESKDVFLADGEASGFHVAHSHVLQTHAVLLLLLLWV